MIHFDSFFEKNTAVLTFKLLKSSYLKTQILSKFTKSKLPDGHFKLFEKILKRQVLKPNRN